MEINMVVLLKEWNLSNSKFSYTTLRHIPKECFIVPQGNLLNLVHCCSLHNIQKLKTTYLYLNRGLDKVNVVCLYSEILLSC